MRKFRDIPIKHKLVCIIMATTVAALLLSGVGVIVSDTVLLRDYLQRDLSSLAQIIADNCTAALAFDDPKAASETLATLKARAHLVSACVYRPDGHVFTTFTRAGAAPVCPAADPRDQIQFTSAGMTLSQPIVLNHRRIGSLVVLYDLGEVRERMRLYGEIVLSVLLASSLIALLLSSSLGAVIATPISQLAGIATAVSAARDYGLRARKNSNDELGVLVSAFNEMLTRIQSRDDELRQALTARGEALHEAQKARDSLKTTLESIADAVISTDLEGSVVFANRVAQNLVKWPEVDLTGRRLDEVFHIINESTRERLGSSVERVLQQDRTGAFMNHTVLIAHDGTETPIDERGAPIVGENGDILGIVLVFRDVAVQRRADETSRLLASIVESSSDAIVGKDLAGIVKTWNKGAERIFGYSAQEMIGRPISLIAPEDRAEEMRSIMQRVARGERIDHYETVRRTKSGALINVSLSTSPLYDALGKITGASKIARDITEQVRTAQRLETLNADLRRSNEKLARSNEDLERFAFLASHDLQEPLRMITVYSQLLVEVAGAQDQQTAACLEYIVGGTRRMRQLLGDLLAYAETGGGPEKELTTVDLNAVIANVTRNLDVAIRDSGAKIEVANRLPALFAYEGHCVSLFQNLIENAIKYRSDRPLDVRIFCEEAEGYLRFLVEDNGIGIAAAHYDKIFSPFKRLHGQNIPGTGIGLAICKRILERYDGRIWVESEEGKGTRFIFTFPNRAFHNQAFSNKL
jgi:PAS domain S-box-containing protein